MTRDKTYPGAKWVDRSRFGGGVMANISKLVWHSTETSGLPSYPTFAPQLTIDPWSREVWQHMRLDLSASTLQDPSSTAVRENRDNVCQIEWVMYCDPARKSSSHHISKLQDDEYKFMAKVAAWFHREWGVPLRAPTFVAYPASYGVRAGQRMSGPEYDRWTGSLGHQHVSGNSHGDPGNINMPLILRYAKDIIDPDDDTPPPPPPGPLKGEVVRRARVIEGGKVTTPFGKPGDMWAAKKHTGADWNHPTKADNNVILAAVSGKVVEVANSTANDTLSWGAAYGCGVIVEDALGDRTLHAHLDVGSVKVKVGAYVNAGGPLGVEGKTGNTTGPHCHVERRHRGADGYGYWDFETPLYDTVRPKTNVIYISDLRAGVTGNSSVYWLRRVLNAVTLPDGANMRIIGDWTDAVTDEVKKYQKMLGHEPDGRPDSWQMRDLIKRAGGHLSTILKVEA